MISIINRTSCGDSGNLCIHSYRNSDSFVPVRQWLHSCYLHFICHTTYGYIHSQCLVFFIIIIIIISYLFNCFTFTVFIYLFIFSSCCWLEVVLLFCKFYFDISNINFRIKQKTFWISQLCHCYTLWYIL